MKQGQESQTAVMVCAARALGDRLGIFAGFSDPTAFALLPEEERERVERVAPSGGRPGLGTGDRDAFLMGRTRMMIIRTLAIDELVRADLPAQLVVLGAGLDGRAWRMEELVNTVVFEVDHPDSQRTKRARAEALTLRAREVRFVPVNFTQDALDAALDAAGHQPTRATTWLWEGVVMYLTRAEIAATLLVVARRSPSGSRVIVAYVGPSPLLAMVGAVVRQAGEPLRSVFTPDELRTLAAECGFDVASDEAAPELAARVAPPLVDAGRLVQHLRVAVLARGSSEEP